MNEWMSEKDGQLDYLVLLILTDCGLGGVDSMFRLWPKLQESRSYKLAWSCVTMMDMKHTEWIVNA